MNKAKIKEQFIDLFSAKNIKLDRNMTEPEKSRYIEGFRDGVMDGYNIVKKEVLDDKLQCSASGTTRSGENNSCSNST